jgi:redox-sensitive bicupin YhaK (pirin superfamily)
MNKTRRKIKKIIEPQFSSEIGGIKWYRSLTPADSYLANPFIALELFQSNLHDFDEPKPITRNYRGVKLFSYFINGKYSVRINQNQIFHARAGDFIEIDTGYGADFEEVYIPQSGKIEGFRLWVYQDSYEKPKFNVTVHSANENRLSYQNGKVQIHPFIGFNADPKNDLLRTDSDLRILDLKISSESKFELTTPFHHNTLAFVYQGRGYFGPYQEKDDILISRYHLILFDAGHKIQIQTKDTPLSLLLVTAIPNQGDGIFQSTSILDHVED